MKIIKYSFIGLAVIIVAGIVYLIGFFSGEIKGEVNADPNMEFVSGEEIKEIEKCEAVNLKKVENARIKIAIGEEDSVMTTGTVKESYTLDELDNLSYGMIIKESVDKQPIYTIAEICQGENTVSFANLDLTSEEMEAHGFSGSFTQFNNEQSNGIIDKIISKAGTYNIYVYASGNGKDWSIAQEATFEVK